MNPSGIEAQSLITKLTNQGITLNSDDIASTSNDPSTPWFIKLLAIGSGWLTAIFMMGVFYFLLFDIFNSPGSLTICGLLAIGLARFSFLGQPSDFREHLALAISLVGQILISIAIVNDNSYKLSAQSYSILFLFHSCLLIVMPNILHRHISAAAVSLSLGLLFSSLGWYPIYFATALTLIALLTFNEFKTWFKPKIMTPLMYGFAIQFLFPVFYNSIFHELFNKSLNQGLWLSSFSMTLVLLVVTLILIKRYKGNKYTYLAASVSAIAVGLASMELSGIAAGCVILLLGHAHSNRKLLTLGVLSLLTQTSFYYYNLEATLLTKSLGLASLGISLLVMRWIMITMNHSAQAQKRGSHE